MRITPEMIEAYDPVNKSVFDYDLKDSPDIPEQSDYKFEYTIQRRDIDTNHHVNNLYYVDFAYEALPDDVYNNSNFDSIQVFYKKELKYKEKIVCNYFFVDGEHIVAIQNEDLSVTHAIIKLK